MLEVLTTGASALAGAGETVIRAGLAEIGVMAVFGLLFLAVLVLVIVYGGRPSFHKITPNVALPDDLGLAVKAEARYESDMLDDDNRTHYLFVSVKNMDDISKYVSLTVEGRTGGDAQTQHIWGSLETEPFLPQETRTFKARVWSYDWYLTSIAMRSDNGTAEFTRPLLLGGWQGEGCSAKFVVPALVVAVAGASWWLLTAF